MENNNYTDYALIDELIVKFSDEYKPYKKPTKKDFKGQWVGYYYQELDNWYDEWWINLQQVNENKTKYFGMQGFSFKNSKQNEDMKEWKELYKEQLASVYKQQEACIRNKNKYRDLQQKENNKRYKGTQSAAGLPNSEWMVIL